MSKQADGPRVIDAIIDHFKGRRDSVVIPEWGDVEIFFTPISYDELETIEKRNPKSNFERSVITLVLKAQDETGGQMFRWGDVGHLMKQADVVIVQRIISAMMSLASADLTEHEAGN